MEQLVLKPLSVGELLDKSFQIYKGNALTLLAITGVLLVPAAIIRLVATAYMADARLVEWFLDFFIQNMTEVALICAISNLYLGKEVSVSAVYSVGMRNYGAVLGATFLMGLAYSALGILVGIFAIGASGSIGCLLIPVGAATIFISTRWSISIPSVVLEDMRAAKGIGRSWSLTKGYFWKVFGTAFAAGLLGILVSYLPTLALNYLVTELVNTSFLTTQLLLKVAEQFAVIISLPFTLGVTVLIYYDLRVRKEAFDLLVMSGETDLLDN